MLFRTSAEAEARRLFIIGVAVIACFTAVCVIIVAKPFARAADRVTVVMDLPYVGQGVERGTPLTMYGVAVGEVTEVKSLPGGTVRLNAFVEPAPAAGLTDTLGVDFRPANYFGVTGINLVPGNGGRQLRNGAQITTVPQGNFTLQALLYRMGSITDTVVTPQLVDVIRKATRYTDGLNPLIESMLTAADSIAKVQTVSTEQLLRNAAGISAAFPGFVDAATNAGYGFNQGSSAVKFRVSGREALPGQGIVAVPGERVSEKYWKDQAIPTLDVVANSLFGAIGKLMSSHANELLPAVDLVQTLTDPVPGLVTPAGLGDTLVELRTRFEKLYAGSAEQRALQVHIVLDRIPGIQAPVHAMGGP
ncbi:Mammalian cell entry related domain protein [Mycolicibacterium holsaticum]|uniref:Mammalian cell entry related domain protein n=1 Tax=Mycolicibacterium holsaticum TaxID=152142 RepID=UPI001C7DDA1E|nr:Mammalian cell entry related domain protein [Mycolicibacterium holsaticum]MDA4108502.1 hypothetical protein [Mycolicibacterium holsaticum DSM 44478 = JCM 12374]QZA12750.1 Mammalian cell entry related domain protein [Mycolicibacterium holsaticum DSM 44478 = JCM 12374]UNC09776.1 Mammalian cell entry related domain protein [Mycolicibacterium holsaticum DSM 44478 = JCM 12374]